MKKISKVVKGGALAVLAALVISGPAFAATTKYDTCFGSTGRYSNLNKTKTGDYKVKCSTVMVDDSTGKKKVPLQLYGKSQGDCTQVSTIVSNPEGCEGNDLNSIITIIINTLLIVIGMVAVIMIIMGGISYATSQGDPSKVKKGKDTILYGIIGLVVALLAFAIVNFVLAALNG